MLRHHYGGAPAGAATLARPEPPAADAPGNVSVSVVVPARNEALNLPHVLTALPEGCEVIVVDGHSVDRTPAVVRATRPDARLLRQTGSGKGDALALGFAHARGDIIVMFDADGSADAEEIPRFIDALLEGADFAKGSRFLTGGGSSDFTPLRRLGNRVLTASVNLLFGTRYTDLCYGYNAFWRRHLPALAVDCDGFEVETLLNIRARSAGLAVTEVPSYEQERLHGESKLRVVRDGLRILRVIVNERRRPRRPVRGSRRPAAAAARSG